jgi:hypothetical protein
MRSTDTTNSPLNRPDPAHPASSKQPSPLLRQPAEEAKLWLSHREIFSRSRQVYGTAGLLFETAAFDRSATPPGWISA